MKIIEKIIVIVHDEVKVTLIKRYKNSFIESSIVEINKLSLIIGFIKKHKIPIFLFFANNNDQQQVYFTEELPVISYLNLQMLLVTRVKEKISNYDLKEVIKIDHNKQKYLFIAANINAFWKNFIKMTSSHFIGISFLALEAQTLIKNFSKSIITSKNPGVPSLQLLMFYDQKNQIQYIIFVDYVVHQTGFINISGISDKIIEGYIIQHLKDVHELFRDYIKDAYLIFSSGIKQSLLHYKDDNYANIVLFTAYEVSVINGMDQIVDYKSKFADLCFVSNILKNNTDFIFNISTQKIAITRQKQHRFLNITSSILVIFLCISSMFFYFKISESDEDYHKLLKTEQRLESELKEAKDILVNHDSKNKEKILIYKFLNSNDISPIEEIYKLKKAIKVKSLEWDSSEIHSGNNDITIKITGTAISDKSTIEKEVMENFSNYSLSTSYDSVNDEIEIVLKHK